MKSRSFAVITLVLLASASTLFAQESVFSDPAVNYTFTVPEPRWKMVIKPSATSPNVEYVYGDRLDAHLEVRRLNVAKTALLSDVVENEEQKLLFRPGYVAGREENFTGRLRGTIFNFEYVAAGKAMSGRFYFLRSDDNTVYLLRFTGQKEVLRTIRNQVDSIARTFAVSG
jgi:hypothetical protein